MDKRRIIYTGIELDAESRNLILEKVKIPEGWKTLCHHSTIYFHTSETQRYKEGLLVCQNRHTRAQLYARRGARNFRFDQVARICQIQRKRARIYDARFRNFA